MYCLIILSNKIGKQPKLVSFWFYTLNTLYLYISYIKLEKKNPHALYIRIKFLRLIPSPHCPDYFWLMNLISHLNA